MSSIAELERENSMLWKKIYDLEANIRLRNQLDDAQEQENAELRQQAKELEAWREETIRRLNHLVGSLLFATAGQMRFMTPAEALAAKEGK